MGVGEGGWKRGPREWNLLHLFGTMSILSSSYWWTQHINWLIISLPPYGLRPGWVRAAAAPIRAPLIRTIIPSPSWGPVTKNGVAPSARLVSPRPDYERQGEETAVWFSRHRRAHRAITPDESLAGGRVGARGLVVEGREKRARGRGQVNGEKTTERKW